MEEVMIQKRIRRDISGLGWALLTYLLILNAAVATVMVIDSVLLHVRQMQGAVYTQDQIEALLSGNGWGYLVTILIGLIVLRLWKGKKFCRETLWTRGKPMKVLDFICLLCLFFSGQAVFQLLAAVIETVLNQFGLSALADIESATMNADTLSMFLYAAIGAPIAEEILFRGLVLRKLEPYGKGVAIVMSALLFGVFHGNLVQTPYAFAVGLILGYVAMEYNIVWAMVLHMINNLVLSDMLGRMTQNLPEPVVNSLFNTIIWGSAMLSVIIVVIRRREIGMYRRENPVTGRMAGCFFTAPGILAVLIFTMINMVSTLVLQAI